jgi:hypothetical protein
MVEITLRGTDSIASRPPERSVLVLASVADIRTASPAASVAARPRWEKLLSPLRPAPRIRLSDDLAATSRVR